MFPITLWCGVGVQVFLGGLRVGVSGVKGVDLLAWGVLGCLVNFVFACWWEIGIIPVFWGGL